MHDCTEHYLIVHDLSCHNVFITPLVCFRMILNSLSNSSIGHSRSRLSTTPTADHLLAAHMHKYYSRNRNINFIHRVYHHSSLVIVRFSDSEVIGDHYLFMGLMLNRERKRLLKVREQKQDADTACKVCALENSGYYIASLGKHTIIEG